MEEETFSLVEDPSHLLPVLEARLPMSCMVYNQIKTFEMFRDELEVLVYGINIPGDLWIVTKFRSGDYRLNAAISPPSEEFGYAIPDPVKHALQSGELFNWGEPFNLMTFPTHISKAVTDLFLEGEGCGTQVTIKTKDLFHMSQEEALKLQLSPPEGYELKPLDSVSGAHLYSETWGMFDMKQSFVGKSLENLPSGGVFKPDSLHLPVSGAIMTGYGLVDIVFTLEEQRRRGFASLALNYAFKEMAMNGLQPCIMPEKANTAGINFVRSLGLQEVSRVACIIGHGR